MKKKISIILCLMMFISLRGLAAAEDGVFDPDVFKGSSLYTFDRYENTWEIKATADMNDMRKDSTVVQKIQGTGRQRYRYSGIHL